MTKSEQERRIEELERRIEELERRLAEVKKEANDAIFCLEIAGLLV